MPASKAAGEVASEAVEAGEGSGPSATTTVGEPVSVTTGEYLETWHDFLVPGALPLDGVRYST
ncbi:hypothetical protein MOR12E_08805 [Methylobacterium oryzae]